jgi:DNA-binding transcriptional ArsR family regulator
VGINAVHIAKARVFKALAHPTRLMIVDKLLGEEMCVSELMEGFQSDISTVSRHLSVLKNAGIVEDERRGTMVYYRLVMPCVVEMLGCVEAELYEKGVRAK